MLRARNTPATLTLLYRRAAEYFCVYEAVYEKFAVAGPDGQLRAVEFRKAGFLAAGDQPEVYFFTVNGQSAVVGIAGGPLTAWQRARRYLSREEKIDVAGLWLRQRIAAGQELTSDNLFIREPELDLLTSALGIKT
jgi:hypothetical protein